MSLRHLFVLFACAASAACGDSTPSGPSTPGGTPPPPVDEVEPVEAFGETLQYAAHRYVAVDDTIHLGGYGVLLDSGSFGSGNVIAVDAEVGTARCADGGAGWVRFRYREDGAENQVQTLIVVCADETGGCEAGGSVVIPVETMRPGSDPAASDLVAAGSGALFDLCETGAGVRVDPPPAMPPLLYRVVDAWGSGPYSVSGAEHEWLRATSIQTRSGEKIRPAWLATVSREVQSIALSDDGSVELDWDPCAASPGCPVSGDWIRSGDFLIVGLGVPPLDSSVGALPDAELRAFADANVPGAWDSLEGTATSGGDYDVRRALVYRILGTRMMDLALADFVGRYDLTGYDLSIGIDPGWQSRQGLQCLPDEADRCAAAESALRDFEERKIGEWREMGISPWWSGFIGYDPDGGFRLPAYPDISLFDGAIALLDLAAPLDDGGSRPLALANAVEVFAEQLPDDFPTAMSIHWGPLEHVLEVGGFCEAEICPSDFSDYVSAFESVVEATLDAFPSDRLEGFGIPIFDGAHFDIRNPYETIGGLSLNRAGETGFNNPLMNLYYAQ